MLKEIPQKPNHTVKGFEEIKPYNEDLPILYQPIYERIFPLNAVYWINSRNEIIYLVSDTQGITCMGRIIEIDANQLEIPSKVSQETFYELLAHNGYKIEDGKLTIHPHYGSVYMTDKGVIVIYLTDGYHACNNTIVDYKITRSASTLETQDFFICLKNNGFTYHPANKCITASERYYYFPSYSLYNGFQPEKKKWINSDADKFYDKHLETFGTFAECANWCNVINKALRRDYPDIEEL